LQKSQTGPGEEGANGKNFAEMKEEKSKLSGEGGRRVDGNSAPLIRRNS
jgi:hypothetical protein